MNSDEFDALIRGSDPTTNPIKPNPKDPLLDESCRHWKTLSARRVIVRDGGEARRDDVDAALAGRGCWVSGGADGAAAVA